jgi:hypothetical protein
MITCKFIGELGNNLFQLATLLELSNRLNFDYCIPANRIYWDDAKNSSLEFNDLFSYEFTYKDVKLAEYIHHDKLEHHDIQFTHRYHNIKSLSDNTCIVGYFQCEKYFSSIQNNIINKYFKFKNNIVNNIKLKYGDLSKTAIVHVRHGRDRLNSCIYSQAFSQLDPSYYINATQHLIQNYDVDNILIISDHMDWCKSNILIPNAHYIENTSNIEDFILFSLCKYNVLGNSTFSWWASYLNQTNPVKIIHPPDQYFIKDSPLSVVDISDMYLNGFHVISAGTPTDLKPIN